MSYNKCMVDKSKSADPKPKPKQATTAFDVTVNFNKCGLQTDSSSSRISAGLVADAINRGEKGADITRGVHIPENVGACIADIYSGKEPSGFKKFLSTTWNNVAFVVKSVGDSIHDFTKNPASEVAGAIVNEVTSTKAAPNGAHSGARERLIANP